MSEGYIEDFKERNFPKMLIGGGFVYVAAKFSETSKYKNVRFKGLFYQAFSKPNIVRMEWTDLNDNVLSEDKIVKYGSLVKLNIYTEALYGQELEVFLYDEDTIDPNDLLKIADKNYFVREVKYEKLKRKSKDDATGSLINMDGTSSNYNQMLSFEVFIDYSWISAAKFNSYIEIFPKVKPLNQLNFLEIPIVKKLKVSNSSNAELMSFQKNATNNPLVVNEIITNIAPYHPCGYKIITINEEKREPFELYNQDSDPILKNPYEIVAGQKVDEIKTLKITLDNSSSTSECTAKQFSESANDHTGNVFEIIKYPEKEISSDHKPTEKLSVSVKSNSSTEIGGIKTGNSKNNEFGNETKLNILELSDKQINFEVRYVFNQKSIQIGNIHLHYLYRYIWPGNLDKAQQYNVKIDSCRFGSQLVQVDVYPNLSWAIRLEYTGDGEIKSSKELISNQTYQNTRTVKFKRQPNQWIRVGKRNLGLKLEVKRDKSDDDAIDISSDVIKVIKDKLEPVNKLLDLLSDAIDGKGANQSKDLNDEEAKKLAESKKNVQEFAAKNGNDPKLQAELEEKRKQKIKADQQKLKKGMENNKKILKNSPKDSKDYKDAVSRNKTLQRKMDKYNNDLIRKPVGVELTYPDFGLEFEWKRVPITSKKHPELYNKTAVELTGKLEAVPIIGAKVYLDFLGLAQRLHPLALAIIAALDIGLKLIGDGSRIITEFSVNAEIEGSFEGFYNMETGENSFNSEDRKNNDKHLIELGGKLAFELLAAIHLELEKKIVNVITGTGYVANLEGKVELKANAEFTGKTLFFADNTGFYGVPSGKFEGIVLSAEAGLKGEFGEINKNPMITKEENMLLEFEALPPSEEKTLDKFYIVKNE